MPFVYNPIYVLGMLSLMVILSIYIGKTKFGKQLGAALLVILFTAVIANLKLIPSASNSIGLYNIIFEYLAPISIFYLLLNVNLNSIKKAGLPMISLFIMGSLATTLGIIMSWVILSPQNILGEDAKIIAGMLTGTYSGGSVNFNAIAIEYGFQKKGVLYAGTIAVDNVVTAVWILVTLVLPMLLSQIWKSKIEHDKISNEQVKISDKGIDLISLAWLTFLGITSFYLSEILVQYFPRIPSILILSTIGIGLAQTKFVSNLKGGHDLGLYLVFAVFGVLNKETGLLLMIIYPLINYEKKFYFIPVLALPSVFLLFNYDLVLQKEFLNKEKLL